jgi:hypothetical protein
LRCFTNERATQHLPAVLVWGRRPLVLVTHFDARNNQLFVDKSRLRELGLKLSQIKEYLETQPFIYAAYTEDEMMK